MKIPPESYFALRCVNDWGPTFRNTSCCDLVVWHPEHGSYLDLGDGFTSPENFIGKTCFTGVNPFEVSELEVFKVNQ